MIRVLVVEDDRSVRLLTRTQLRSEYQILEAEDGEAALELLEHEKADIILVDICMPRMNGYDFVEQLRLSGDDTPVIMLTAMNTYDHKKQGFAAGIDDYMTKPIDYEELKWRMKALLRRANISSEKKLVIGKLVLDQSQYTAVYDGENITLTNKEFDLLFKFLSYPGTVFTKQELMDDIWGYDTETEFDTIKTYVSKLRSKFAECGEFELVALRGIGYKAVIHAQSGTQK